MIVGDYVLVLMIYAFSRSGPYTAVLSRASWVELTINPMNLP